MQVPVPYHKQSSHTHNIFINKPFVTYVCLYQGSQYRTVPEFRSGLGIGTVRYTARYTQVYRAVYSGVPSTVALLQYRTGNRRSAYRKPVGPVLQTMSLTTKRMWLQSSHCFQRDYTDYLTKMVSAATSFDPLDFSKQTPWQLLQLSIWTL